MESNILSTPHHIALNHTVHATATTENHHQNRPHGSPTLTRTPKELENVVYKIVLEGLGDQSVHDLVCPEIDPPAKAHQGHALKGAQPQTLEALHPPYLDHLLRDAAAPPLNLHPGLFRLGTEGSQAAAQVKSRVLDAVPIAIQPFHLCHPHAAETRLTMWSHAVIGSRGVIQ